MVVVFVAGSSSVNLQKDPASEDSTQDVFMLTSIVVVASGGHDD